MAQGIAPLTPEELALFNEFLSSRFGLVFPEHKREILASRLAPRLRVHHVHRYIDYYLLLQYDLERELDPLTRAVTNNESYFFREKAQLESLQGERVAELLAGGTPGELRILSAGCSSGEEPYSINAQVRGSALGLLAYRRGVRFASGNIIDPRICAGAVRYDVIFCRNVLIYFSELALKTAIDNFTRLLRLGGLLFLGHSESIIGLTPAFQVERLDQCIAYRRVEP